MSWALALGIASGALGLFSTGWQKHKNQEELKHQKGLNQKQFDLNRQYGDDIYSLRKGEALDQLGIQKDNLNTRLNYAVDDYNTSLLAQAFGIQDARIQGASATGASLAAEAASGTRGNAANEMVRSYATQGLERNIDLQEKQNVSQLNQMITGANDAAGAIEREKDSWAQGGYRDREKSLQDNYNYSIFDLGQKEYDRQIQQSDPFELSWDNLFDYVGGAFSGAYSGMSMGMGFDELSKKTDSFNFGSWFEGETLREQDRQNAAKYYATKSPYDPTIRNRSPTMRRVVTPKDMSHGYYLKGNYYYGWTPNKING